MNKWHGKIGFETNEEVRPGVWAGVVAHSYYGDVISNNRNLQISDSPNGTVTVSAKISIVADEYARNHFHTMKYIEFMGANWEVATVEPLHPRLILTLGGKYDGEQA